LTHRVAMSSDAFREKEGTFYPPKGNKSSREASYAGPRALFLFGADKKINLEAGFHFGVFKNSGCKPPESTLPRLFYGVVDLTLSVQQVHLELTILHYEAIGGREKSTEEMLC